MTTVNQESALGQLMRMVGRVPQPMPQANGPMSASYVKTQSTPIARPQPSRPAAPPVSGQVSSGAQKRKATAPLSITPTPPDPRVLFPAAMGGMPPMIPGLPSMPIKSGGPIMNAQFLPPQLAAQMMMNPMMSAICSIPQLPPELLALAANLAASGGNPMDAISLAQNPAMLAKLYSDYAAHLQFQHQQLQFQSFLAQQQAQATQPAKKRSTPTARTPTATNANKLDPLASLQNMVNPNAKTQRTSPTAKSEVVIPIVLDEDEVNNEVVVVDDEVKSDKSSVATASSTTPKSLNGGSAFSIAEILQNANESIERQMSCPSRPATTSTANGDSVSPQTNDSNVDSQLSDATDISGQSTRSKFVKKTSAGGGNKGAQRKGHIEYHRRMKGINARCKSAQCQLCGSVVTNNSSEITHHVYSHSKKPLFGCVNCDARYIQKVDIFRHSISEHPKVTDHEKFNDFRDMGYLCDLLEKCFPRNAKLVVDTLLTRLLKACKGVEFFNCRLCEKDVAANVMSLKTHLTQHPRFRCKLCHFTCEDEGAQISHGQEHRQTSDSTDSSALYNVTSAAPVLSGVLTDCFGNYMGADQLEFAEEMAAMDRAQDCSRGSSPVPTNKSA